MFIPVHCGIARYLRHEIGAKLWILITTIVLDAILLFGFIWVKIFSDPLAVGIAVFMMLGILVIEVLFCAITLLGLLRAVVVGICCA